MRTNLLIACLLIIQITSACSANSRHSETKEMVAITTDQDRNQAVDLTLDFLEEFNRAHPASQVRYSASKDYWNREALRPLILKQLRCGNGRACTEKDLADPNIKESLANGMNWVSQIHALQIKLGKLDRVAFDFLKAHFQHESFVTFDPNREYRLDDFLSPIIQAAIDHIFLFESGIDRLGNHTSLTTNCWGTAYEFLRHRGKAQNEYRISPSYLDDPNVHGVFIDPGIHLAAETPLFAGGTDATGLFSEDEIEDLQPLYREKAEQRWKHFRFETVNLFAKDLGSPQVFMENMRYGDIVLIRRSELEWDPGIEHRVVHAAIYVGGGVFFEKAGVNSFAPYRFTTLDDIVTAWPLRRELSDGRIHHYTYTARRLHTPPGLPHIKDVIIDHRKSMSAAAADEYRILFDPRTGRGYLEDKAYVLSLSPPPEPKPSGASE